MKRVNMFRLKKVVTVFFFFLSGIFIFAEETPIARKAVVNVELTTKDAAVKELVGAMDDLLGAKISGPYFNYIDKSLCIKNFNNYADSHSMDKKTRELIQKDLQDSSSADFSKMLQLTGSALSIAEMLGADVMVNVSVFNPIKEVRKAVIDGVASENIFYSQQLSYNVFDLQTSASYLSGQVKRTRVISNNANVKTEAYSLSVSMIQEGIEKIGEEILKKVSENKKPANAIANADVSFSFSFEEFAFPVLVKDKNGENVVSKETYLLSPKSVNISVNGIDYPLAIDANGKTESISLPKGRPIQIDISRKDFRPISRVIKISKDAQVFSFDLAVSNETMAKLKQDLADMSSIAGAVKLTDAQIGILEGKKKFWEQSGYRIDVQRSTQGTEKVEIKEEYKKEASIEKAE